VALRGLPLCSTRKRTRKTLSRAFLMTWKCPVCKAARIRSKRLRDRRPSCNKICYNFITISDQEGRDYVEMHVCGYEYDEAKEGTPFESFRTTGPVRSGNAPKSEFEKVR